MPSLSDKYETLAALDNNSSDLDVEELRQKLTELILSGRR
jgi:hypothetical protein